MPDFSSDSVFFDTTDAPAGIAAGFSGVSDKTIDWATDLLTSATSKAYDQVQSVGRQEPTLQFTTEAVAVALNILGLGGKCLESDSAAPGYNVSGLGFIHYAQRHDPCGPAGRSSTSNNFRINVTDGHVVPGSLSATVNSNATLQFTTHAISDGTNSPVALTFASSVPALTLITTDEMYGLYNCKIANVETTNATSVTVDFGLQIVKPQIANGTIWPTTIRITKIQPKVTIRISDPAFYDNFVTNNLGTPCTSANTIIRLSKRLPDGAFDPGASRHITIGINGLAHATTISGSGGAVDELEVQITTREVASTGTAPLVISTTASL